MATTARLSSDSFATVRTGSRPGGCPRPMRRSWLRRNRLQKPSGTLYPYRRVFRSACCRSEVFQSAHFFGEAPKRRPWATNAKIARLLLPGVPNPAFLVPQAVGIPPLPIQASILSHPHHLPTASAAPRLREPDKPAGDYRENAGGNDCGALHLDRREHSPALLESPYYGGTVLLAA
jgi:hypothetical protein